MADYILEANSLTKFFGNKTALENFSLKIERGGIHALIGNNGAGKSTLFRMLLGFLTPDSGMSSVLGENSIKLSPSTRGRIGYVNEEHTLPDWLKVSNLKKMQQSYYPLWKEDIYQNIIANFDVEPRQEVRSLSRGERAGLNLALALAQNPELLILDEPTLGLDVVAKQEFLNSVLFCTEFDTTVIYCSHQMDEVERLADDLIIMGKGRLIIRSAPEEFSPRVQLWIVDAQYQELIQGKVSNFLDGSLIEDKYQFYILDQRECFVSQLALLGIKDAVSTPIGLANAVRAILSENHVSEMDSAM